MRAYVVVALTLAAGVASARLGDVVGSFPGPDANIRGVGRSANYLYVIGLSSPNMVYRCNPTTGSVFDAWETPSIIWNRALAVTWGDHVWVGSYRDDVVYECDGFSGSIYNSWDAGHDPFGLAPLCTGDGGRGTTAIFTYDTVPSFVFLHNLTTGSINSSFPLSHETPYDFTYDHRNQLLWKYYTPSVYGYNPTTGSVIASFPRPYPSTCYSLAYYGEYLWISVGDGYIFIVHCPGTVAVRPSSLGRVKALFR